MYLYVYPCVYTYACILTHQQTDDSDKSDNIYVRVTMHDYLFTSEYVYLYVYEGV